MRVSRFVDRELRTNIGRRNRKSSSRRLRSSILLAATATAPLITSHALGGTYSFTYAGSTAGDYGTATNFSSSTIPGATDTALFNKAQPSGLITNTAAHTVGFITFDTGIGSVVLGTVGGGTFTLPTTGIIQNTTTLTGSGITDTVNAPIVIGAATATTGGVGSFLSNSGTISDILSFGGPISGASLTTVSGGGSLQLGGTNTGANLISGVISNGAGAGSLTVNKQNIGTWILSGTNTFTGAITALSGFLDLTGTDLSAGTVQVNGALSNASNAVPSMTLDYTAGQGPIVGSAARLGFSNGTLTLLGTGGTQTVGSVSLPSVGVGTLVLNNESLVVTTSSVNPTNLATGYVDTSKYSVTFPKTAATFGNLVDYDGTGYGIGYVPVATGLLSRLSTSNTTQLLTSGGSTATNYYVSGTQTETGNVNANTLTIDSTNPGLLTLSSTGSIQLGSYTIFDSANGLTTGGSPFTITGGAIGVNTAQLIVHQFSSGTLTLGSVLNVAGTGFSKDGPGTLLITSTNSFAGPVYVSGGTLAIGANTSVGQNAFTTVTGVGALGNGSNTLVLGPSATLDLNGHYLGVASLSTNGGTVTNGAAALGTLSFTTSGNVSNSATIVDGVGGGSLAVVYNVQTLSANGANVISGTNAYTGGTYINNGNSVYAGIAGTATTPAGLRLSNPVGFGTGTIYFNNGFVDYTGTAGANIVNPINLSGAFNGVGNDAYANFSGGLFGSGTFTQSGNGSTTFTGNNAAFTGTIDVDNYNNRGIDQGVVGIASTSAENLSQATVSLANHFSGTASFNSALTYSGTLTTQQTIQIGAVTAGTLTGGTAGNIASGVATFGFAGILQNSTPASMVIYKIGSLNTNSNFNGVIADNEYTIYNAAANAYYAATGAYSGLEKTGSGVLVLNSANLYSGPTILDSGVLLENGTFAAATSFAGAANQTTVTGTGTANLAVGQALTGSDFRPGTIVTSINTGTSVSISSQALASGTVIAPVSSSLSPNSIVEFNGGVLGLGKFNFTEPLGTTAGSVQFLGSGGFAAYTADRTVNLGGAGTTLTFGTGGFIPAGTGSLIFGDATATNAVQFSNAIDLGTSSETVNVIRGGSTLGTGSYDASLNGIISSNAGTYGLTKVGGGVLQLAANNTYLGPTSINAGTLRLASAGSIGTSSTITVGSGASFDVTSVPSFAVNTGQTLNGSGTVAGAQTVSGTLQAGVGAANATLTTGAVTFNGGGTFSTAINSSTGSNDVLSSSSVNLGAGLAVLNVSDVGTAVASTSTYTLITTPASGLTGYFSGLTDGSTLTVGLNAYEINYYEDAASADYVTLTALQSTPEPTSVSLIAGGAAVGLMRRRRRTASTL